MRARAARAQTGAEARDAVRVDEPGATEDPGAAGVPVGPDARPGPDARQAQAAPWGAVTAEAVLVPVDPVMRLAVVMRAVARDEVVRAAAASGVAVGEAARRPPVLVPSLIVPGRGVASG